MDSFKTKQGAEIVETSCKINGVRYRSVKVSGNSNTIHVPHTHHKTSLMESVTSFFIASGLQIHIIINCLSNPPERSPGILYFDVRTNNLLSCDGETWFNIKLMKTKELPANYSHDHNIQGTFVYDKETCKPFFYDGKNWFIVQMLSQEKADVIYEPPAK